jgi:hypothetical protein
MWPHERPEAHFTSYRLLLDKEVNFILSFCISLELINFPRPPPMPDIVHNYQYLASVSNAHNYLRLFRNIIALNMLVMRNIIKLEIVCIGAKN